MRFVAFVNFEGALLAMTEGGAVWHFDLKLSPPAWHKVADGPLYAAGLG